MNRRNRRKKRIARLGTVAALLLAVLTVVFLFRVKKVNVYGNSRHSSDEIAKGLMHNWLTQNTLYLQWEYRNGSVPDTLPFLGSLQVQMKSPMEINVEVTEKELAGYVDKGEYAYFDQEGYVMELTDQEYEGFPLITGADIDTPDLYKKLPTRSSAQLRTILSVTQLLGYQELKAQEIRFDENGGITVYIDGVEAVLGQDEYLEEKIANLRAILKKTDGERGTLHLESFTGKSEMTTTFTVSDEPETEPETGTDHPTASGTDMGADEAGSAGITDGATGNADGTGAENAEEPKADSVTISMVFDASGTLVYNVHIANGVVVDAGGNPVSGCSVDENGYAVDAYMNRFDPKTGELVQ